MKKQENQELTECLAELSAIVDYYNPAKEYFFAAAVFSLMAICLIVIGAVGLFWGLILLGAGGIPIAYKLSDSKCSPSEKELSKRACILMSSCINQYKYPEKEIYFLDYTCYGNNLSLYNEFISLFPDMASKKLKKLASIRIKD